MNDRRTFDSVKELNRRLVIEQIRTNPETSRSEIVETTGLSKATVSSIVSELLDAGLVQEIGSQSQRIGRPRVLLSLIPDAALTIGAELTSKECRTVLVNLYAEPVRQVSKPVPSEDLSPQGLLPLLQECVAEVTTDIDVARILALGVCVPGIVDPTSGTVALSVILPWEGVALAQMLQERFLYPVAVFSRGNAATWGERWYGAGRDAENLLYVRVGTGVVAGLVIHGHPYLGRNFGAGELGHVTVQPNGIACRCGNRGCLATVATTGALLRRVRQLLQEDLENSLWTDDTFDLEHLSLADVIAAAQAQNPAAIQAFVEIGRWLAIALASTLNLLNLDIIVIGGPMAEAGEVLFAPLRQELARRTLSTHLKQTRVVPSLLRENAPSVGAASLVLHELTSPTSPIRALSTDEISLF